MLDWQLQELERRKAAYENDPQSGVSWEELKKRLRDTNGR
ncbi:MAG: addiction module protein [Planctomycetales bacterium]